MQFQDTDIKKFVSARIAAKRVGYSQDYVSRLAREGKVASQKEGKQWMIDLDALKLFSLEQQREKRERQGELSQKRKEEQVLKNFKQYDPVVASAHRSLTLTPLLESAVVSVCLALIGVLSFNVSFYNVTGSNLVAGVHQATTDVQDAFVLESALTLWNTLVTEKIVERTGEEDTSVTDIAHEGHIVVPQITASSGVIIVRAHEGAYDAQSVEEAFSDPVAVEFHSSHSGVIVPEFRERHGERYPFVLKEN